MKTATRSELDEARVHLLKAGSEIHSGDNHDALWSLYDCLMRLMEHLQPGITTKEQP